MFTATNIVLLSLDGASVIAKKWRSLSYDKKAIYAKEFDAENEIFRTR